MYYVIGNIIFVYQIFSAYAVASTKSLIYTARFLSLLHGTHIGSVLNHNNNSNHDIHTPDYILKSIHVNSAVDGGPVSSYFGVYQQKEVESESLSIRTDVPTDISAARYRKVLIVKKFHYILTLTNTPFVFLSDLITTVDMYFP